MSLADIQAEAVAQAVDEFDRLGRDTFLRKYGYRKSKRYLLRLNGSFYDSKAIVGAAHGFARPDLGPLKAADFSAGELTVVRRLRSLGFEVISSEDDGVSESPRLQQALQTIMDLFPKARLEPFQAKPELWAAFEHARAAMESLEDVGGNPHVRVKWPPGQGNWAKVPWIALLDDRVTNTTQRGVYVVLLFRQDMSAVYLTLNQGVTQPKADLGARAGRERLRARAREIRATSSELAGNGFMLDDEIDLRTESGLGADYEVSTIAYKLYPSGQVPHESAIEADVEALMDAYQAYVDGQTLEVTPIDTSDSLFPVVEDFANGLLAAHLQFGSRHTELVRSFIASLATKRFVILTGLSGSGKTQIAIRFGEWLGDGRWTLEPVRPDWTGSESLFGFIDALQPSAEGRPAWHVPRALRFMLGAVRDPQHPYLLILDEMNLAHVERYFSDVLSGMESETPVLPNLVVESDGRWRQPLDAPERLRFPKNLFMAGTVNVDETTYMFSPKVLDRANVFEFRVETHDLSLDYQKPVSCPPGAEALVRTFLAIASNDVWQRESPAEGIEEFGNRLREVHVILSAAGYEFGHRVYYEATRFAAILDSAGDSDPMSALDLQILQKVLPRLHGSRRRLEPLLCALAHYCYDLTIEQSLADGPPAFDPLIQLQLEPRLPLSFEKLKRMTRNVRANQFTSFTE
jgi:5-methylcytosine-specific restriction enzyme B